MNQWTVLAMVFANFVGWTQGVSQGHHGNTIPQEIMFDAVAYGVPFLMYRIFRR